MTVFMSLLSGTMAAVLLLAGPALAAGVFRAHGSGIQAQQAHSHPAQQQGPAHARFGGPRLERRADPNDLNPYRPMFSLDATNPGEPHPYFRTPRDGFGYPAARTGGVYQGNGVYVIPR